VSNNSRVLLFLGGGEQRINIVKLKDEGDVDVAVVGGVAGHVELH
jgi:hypothetical protein